MSLSAAEKLHRLQLALDCGGGTHDVADVVELIRTGKAQFWERGDGCIVSELNEYPLRKDIRFWLISGDLKDCLALEDDILRFAISEGCTTAVATGRRGWGRAARPTGWQEWECRNFYKSLSK